jgi:hypothetical protein
MPSRSPLAPPRRSFRRTLALAAVIAASAAAAPAATPLLAGPPWISIEMPANPFDQASRGAFLLVHAFHHGTPMNFPVTGRAEGIVGGQRRTVPLQLERTSRQGVYALRNQWGSAGVWTLVLTVTQAPGDGATALVDIAGDGQVTAVRVPTARHREGDFPRAVTSAEVEAGLRARSSR